MENTGHIIEESYAQERKRFNLPDFNKIDFEFEISSLEETKFILREVRRKMIDKIEHFINLLEEVLQPETTVANLHECNFFDQEEKEKIFRLYSKLMRLNRKSLCLDLSPNDKEEADFIITLFNEWIDLKKDVALVLNKMKESCEIEAETKENPQYFG